MSFYVKLIAFVIVATFGAQYLITKIVFQTQGLPDRFTHTYKERTTRVPSNFGKEPAERTQAALDQEGALADAINSRLKRIEAQRVARDEAIGNSNAVAPPPVPYAPDAQFEATAKTNTNQNTGNRNNAPRERADSDADMRVRGNTSTANGIERESIKANRPTEVSRLRADVPTKKATLVEALDLAYSPPQSNNCALPGNDPIVVGVLYRQSSYAIKGESLSNIDKLVKIYQRCGGGLMLLMPKQNAGANTGEKAGTAARLIQQRQDEVKYYLLQRNVEKDHIVYSDNS